MIASADESTTIIFWDARSRAKLRTLEGHTVAMAASVPPSPRMMTASLTALSFSSGGWDGWTLIAR